MMKNLNAHKNIISVEKLPDFVLRLITQNYDLCDETKVLSKIEKSLVDTLLDFQKDGIVFGVSRGGRCLLGDDMGLGE
jgi:SWI/SNF-related matrix-associated actin-dependent regulator 1 of chromatin subfamily A